MSEEKISMIIWIPRILLLLVMLAFPLRTNAATFSPFATESEEKTAKGIIEKGETVCLFQSGTEDVRKTIAVDDVLSVYRETKSNEVTEVGKIKVLFYVGTDYIKGEVIEGELKAGDVAKKGNAAGLIISTDDKCK
jgi:hypothetical protein